MCVRDGDYGMCEGGGCGVCVPCALSQIHTCMRMVSKWLGQHTYLIKRLVCVVLCVLHVAVM